MPTFGYTTSGSNVEQVGDNEYEGSLFTSPSDVFQAISISVKCQESSGTADFKGVIVKHSDLTIVAVADPVTVSSSNWYTGSFSSPPVLQPDTEYILGVIPTSTTFYFINYDNGDTDQSHFDINNYSSPVTLTSPIHDTKKYSIYVTYSTTDRTAASRSAATGRSAASGRTAASGRGAV